MTSNRSAVDVIFRQPRGVFKNANDGYNDVMREHGYGGEVWMEEKTERINEKKR